MRFLIQLRLLAAVVVACSLATGQSVPQSANDRIAAITSALGAGQFEKALSLLQPELAENPRVPKLWALRGIALSGKGDKKEALAAFQHALEISPDYLPALEGAAQIEYDLGDKDAASLLHRILLLRPKNATSHAMLAVLAYRRGDCATAVTHFEQSGSLVESQPGALLAYGDCLVTLKQNDKAIALFARALDLRKTDLQKNDLQKNDLPNAGISLRARLASLQLMAQRPKDAIATLQPMLQANTANADILALASSAYEADGNTPEAVRILREAIVANPHDVDLYVDFANISLDHQSYQVGADMIGAGLVAEPNAAALYVARGILYVQLAQFDKAEADFDKANTLDPQRSIGSAAEGLAAVQANDPDRALATVQQKLAKAPNDAFLLYLEAEILTQRGPDPGSAEFRVAMESARKAISLRPSLGVARDVLAKLYLQEGQNAPAIEQSRKALITDPKDQTAVYHLIQALRKTGQTEEVPALLKRLAELRMQGTKEDAERNRYKLVEDKSPLPEKTQP